MRVRTGSIYTFNRNGMDIVDPRSYQPADGTKVKVIQPFGCPKNNTMGQCYVATLKGEFIGMVDTASLSR